MINWAENEVRLACEREKEFCETTEGANYGIYCYESAMKGFKTILEDMHTNHSIGFTREILYRLLKHKPLTALTDTEDAWTDKNNGVYQNIRYPSLFKIVDKKGNTTYIDLDRAIFKEISFNDCKSDSESWFISDFILQCLDKLYPITFPYYPAEDQFKVWVKSYLINPDNNKFDTVVIEKIITPEGEINNEKHYFTEIDGEITELNETEFNQLLSTLF